MAPITVGSTRVSLTPDLTQFGPILRSELPPVVERIGGDLGKAMGDAMSRRLAAAMPDAMRDAGRLMTPAAAKAGADAGDAFATGFETKLAARLAKFRPAVTVDIKLDDAKARAQLDKLTADRTLSLTPELDDAKAKSALDRLTADRTVKVAVRFDDAKAKASLAALGKGKPVRIRADLDDAAAVAKLAALTRPRAAPVVAVVATAQAEADLTAILAPRHIAVTPVLEAPSASAISEYASGVQSALSKAGGLVLGAPTISTELGQQVASYIATISEPIQVPIEPRISLLRRMLINRWRNQVGEDIQIAVSPELAAAEVLTVRSELTDLGRQVTVSVAADWDTTAAGIVQAHILALQSPVQVPIQPIFDSSATPVVAAHLQRLKETIEVIIKPIWDSAAAAIVEAHLTRFKEPVEVPVKPVWDAAAAAAVRAQLARLASPTTAPISPTLLTGSLLAAGFLLDRLARRRTADIGVRVDQNSIRTLGLLGSSGQTASAGFGSLIGSAHLLAGAVASALPMLASLGSALAQLAPAAALAAPALVTLGASFAAIKIGTSGVGEAFKAAFAPATEGARQATAAARQTENAQRSLASAQRSVADAQRSLKDAQVAASEQIQQAQRRVGDAERDLSQAQRDAATAQRDLTAARRQAVRDLEDMNARLKGAELDQRAATLAVQQAEEDLARTRSDPSATQLQIQQAELSAERARQSVEDQRRDLKRMRSETADANRAGVEGARNVVQAKQQIARADQDVADRQRALRDSQEEVTKAQVQGQRRVADAQRAVADAQRSVADAARNLAEVQQSAASATDKFADAMAKLSPNARDFVTQVKAMAPAWDGLKLGVQDALFDGLGKRLTSVGRQVLPTLETGLAGTATQLNLMGRGALTAVSNLQKAGTLRGVFDTVRSGLSDLRDIPGEVVTGLGRLTVAAQPAFERVTTGAASAVDRVMQSLTAGMESGRLTESINTALNVAVSFGKVLADAFGIVKNVMSTAADAGGDFFAVVGSALAEIRRVTALPEVQAALKSIFSALQAVASLLATTLGAALQAVLPLLAALAPAVTALARAFGPVVKQLAGALGTALMPIIKALAPVLDTVGRAILGVVKALAPVLVPLGKWLGGVVGALAPIISFVVKVIVQLVQQLSGPLQTIIQALIPWVSFLGKVFTQVFAALMPAIKPLIGIVGQMAKVLATVFSTAMKALIPALMPLVPVIVMVVKLFGELLGAILKPLAPVITMIAKVFGQVLGMAMKVIAPIIKMVADIFKELLPVFRPLFPVIGELVGALAQLLKPLLQLVMLALKPLLAVVGFVAKLLVGALGAALKFLVPIVVTVLGWVAKLATFITKAVTAIVKAFAWLFDKLLGHSIIPDIVNGAIKWFKGLWHKAVDIFTTIKNKVKEIWDKLWGGIKSAASAAWGAVRKGFDKFADGFKSAFSKVKSAIGKIWDGLKALVKAPIKFWIEVIYNKGIVSVWNKTAAKIPGVPDLKTMTLPKGFTRGGILPGQSSWRQGDDQLVPMRRGEGVYVSEAMRDPYERARLHAVNAAAMRGQSLKGVRGFAEGGILGDLGSTVGKVLGKGADIVRGGIADLAEAAFSPVKAAVNDITGSKSKGSWPSMIARAPIGLIDKAIDFIRGKEEATIGRGRWLRPVNAPYGTKFGVKGRMWSSGRHTGLDFPARTGTPVRAVAAGRVISAVAGGPYGPYGMNVQIRHGGDFSSLYAHMSAVLVKAREAVAAGQRIGRVGATGNVTGPHLHLEARMGGRAIDPMPYLESGGPGGGKGVARWRSTVVTALNEVNQSVSHVSTVLRRMNQESGGNPNAVNRYDSNWKAGHPSVGLMQVIGCVPLSTKILTRRGWLSHNEVEAGDETLGFNPETGRNEWTAIKRVVHYADAAVRRIGNKSWHADVTGEHRWWSETTRDVPVPRDTICPDCGRELASPRGYQVHMSKAHNIDRPQPGKRYVGEFVRTDDLGAGHRLRVAARADTGQGWDLSLQDVRLIAWLQGDGHIGQDRAGAYDASIYQSKPEQVIKLRALLADVPHGYYTRQRSDRHLTSHQFKLRRAYATDLIKRSRVMEMSAEAFVLGLSAEQRAAWLDSMIDAEGNRQAGRNANWKEFVRITQRDGDLQDAIKLAVYMEGFRPSVSRFTRYSDKHSPAANIGLCRPHVAPSMFNATEDLGKQDVWCVETELGTWTMEQDGQVMLTGNSTFRAYAGRYRDRGPFMYGVSTNPLANIYASMRYALSRYGSLPRAYNRPGGYAKGGTARPGELAWVGEQGPELMRVLDDGVRIFPHEQSKRMAAKMGSPVPGFASGGKITVAGKRIDTGPIRASVGADFLKALAGTSAAISSAMTKVATALKNAFKGVKTTLDDRLIKSVNSYSKKLRSLADQRDKIRSQITAATTMATEQADTGRQFAALTSLPSSGLPFGAGGIAAGMKVRLGQLKVFSANLATLGRRGLSKDLIGQIIAAGPDSGAPYAAALVKATDSELKGINTTQKQITDASKAHGNAAADAMFDAGSQAGKGFLTGLKAQEASIVKQMSALAQAIQRAIRNALKMRSPSLVMRALGSLTLRSYGMGVVDQIRPVATTAGHAAAAVAARMAAVVRSTTAAGTARVENNTSTTTVGDRVLNYNATTREVASRQSILAALAQEDMLHRPVMSGG